jgi:hypothetical protein
MPIRSGNFAVPLACEEARRFGCRSEPLTELHKGGNIAAAGHQGTDATPAPLPLLGFPVVNSSSQAERRRPRAHDNSRM